MIIEQSVKIRNYKCFGSEEQGFEKILPVNIIIGKNNSGKSSLIDLVEYIVNPKEHFLENGRDKLLSEVIVTDVISKDAIEIAFQSGKRFGGAGIPGMSHYDYGLTLVGQNVKYILTKKKKVFEWEIEPKREAETYVNSLEANMSSPLFGYSFLRVTAEREISPENPVDNNIDLLPNGKGATNIVRQVVTSASHNLNLVKKDLLGALNQIVAPDIEYLDIAPRETRGIWEIFLEDKYGSLVPLSKMGSGIKTILLVILNLIVIPELKGIKKKDIVFGFEELENNLHPSLQRRLFRYIIKYAKEFGSHFFITTHSNIVIDMLGVDSGTQILHVQRQNDFSVVKTVDSFSKGRGVLKDMDFKASDLLMSNGVVWVEGPSDVVYIELLLGLYQRYLGVEGMGKFDYTIQSLATAVWKYAGFVDFDWNEMNDDIQSKIISLEKLNSNHLLVIDNDNNYEDIRPSCWSKFENGNGKNKAKLVHESMKFSNHKEDDLINNYGNSVNGTLFFWINKGTFESYLEFFIKNKGNKTFGNYFDLDNGRGYFEKKRTGPQSSKSKVELAAEIAKFCIQEDISLFDIAPKESDLFGKIESLYKTILSWN